MFFIVSRALFKNESNCRHGMPDMMLFDFLRKVDVCRSVAAIFK